MPADAHIHAGMTWLLVLALAGMTWPNHLHVIVLINVSIGRDVPWRVSTTGNTTMFAF